MTDLDRQVVASISCKHNLNIREFQKTLDSLALPGTSGNFAPDSDACVNEVERDSNGFIIVPPTSVEIFDNAISDSLWSSGLEFVAQPKPDKNRTSLREVSHAHSLNKLQHASFQLMGAALLAELKFDAGLEKDKPEQIVCYLGGAGGTGKSRVIKAL